jgi:hypothetical protein
MRPILRVKLNSPPPSCNGTGLASLRPYPFKPFLIAVLFPHPGMPTTATTICSGTFVVGPVVGERPGVVALCVETEPTPPPERAVCKDGGFLKVLENEGSSEVSMCIGCLVEVEGENCWDCFLLSGRELVGMGVEPDGVALGLKLGGGMALESE